MALFAGLEEYQKDYAEIGEKYTPWELEETMILCMEEIAAEVETLIDEGKLEEARKTCDSVIACLQKAEWKNPEDIKEFELRRSHVDEVATQRLMKLLSVVDHHWRSSHHIPKEERQHISAFMNFKELTYEYCSCFLVRPTMSRSGSNCVTLQQALHLKVL